MAQLIVDAHHECRCLRLRNVLIVKRDGSRHAWHRAEFIDAVQDGIARIKSSGNGLSRLDAAFGAQAFWNQIASEHILIFDE